MELIPPNVLIALSTLTTFPGYLIHINFLSNLCPEIIGPAYFPSCGLFTYNKTNRLYI